MTKSDESEILKILNEIFQNEASFWPSDAGMKLPNDSIVHPWTFLLLKGGTAFTFKQNKIKISVQR